MNKVAQENKMKKILALEYAKRYCAENNLSVDKLMRQQFELIYDSAIFAQPSAEEAEGMANDRATMPMPTLIIKLDGDRLDVEQTEYTKKYLMR